MNKIIRFTIENNLRTKIRLDIAYSAVMIGMAAYSLWRVVTLSPLFLILFGCSVGMAVISIRSIRKARQLLFEQQMQEIFTVMGVNYYVEVKPVAGTYMSKF